MAKGFKENKSMVNVYTEEEVDALLNGTVLYENQGADITEILANTTKSSIILSEDVSNYDEIEIFTVDSEGAELSSKASKKFGFKTTFVTTNRTSTKVVLKSLTISVSGTGVNLSNTYETHIMLDGTSNSHTAGKYIGIVKIVGTKKAVN